MSDLLLTLQQEQKELEILVNKFCIMLKHTKKQLDLQQPMQNYTSPALARNSKTTLNLVD